jgi:hypothetical protein
MHDDVLASFDFKVQASMVHLNAKKMGWNFPIKVSLQQKQMEPKLMGSEYPFIALWFVVT